MQIKVCDTMGSYQSQKMWDLSQDLALSKQQSNVLPQKLQIPHCKQNRSKYPHPCGKCHTLFSFLSHFLYASLYLLYTYHIHVTLNLGLSLEGHVKEHTVVLVVWDRYCEVSLQLGLVKTWECSPCISWLKMGGRESPDNIKWYCCAEVHVANCFLLFISILIPVGWEIEPFKRLGQLIFEF